LPVATVPVVYLSVVGRPKFVLDIKIDKPANTTMSTFNTPGLHGYSLKFSPFIANRLACVSCQNYGISGM